MLTSAFFVVFSAYLAISRYGNIKLGPDDAEPEFSTFSWVSMMFATGMGIGLMFYGVAEPLTTSTTPPMGLDEPGTPEAAGLSMEYTFFHWGLHPWAMYAVIGLAIGYFAYRKGYGNLVSGAFRATARRPGASRPRQGDRRGRDLRHAVRVRDVLGLGALQITGGIDNVFGSGGGSKVLAVAVIGFLTLCFVISAVSGIEKGVKYLSNANAVAAGLLVLFIFVVGPTVFILGTFTESLGGYLTHLPTMSFRTGVFGGSVWLHTWTIFYWAWWISWTPFVGMFIARISKGRTIREYVVFVIWSRAWCPSCGSRSWVGRIQPSAQPGRRHASVAGEGIENALFDTLREFPLSGMTVALAIFLIAIFFVTGADSASIVMGMLSQHGQEEPHRWLVVFWGVAMGAVAAVLLWSGGLEGLQTLVIIVAGPFMLLLITMCVSCSRRSGRNLRSPPACARSQAARRAGGEVRLRSGSALTA